MNKLISLCLTMAMTLAATSAQAIKVHTIGDSTMQTYDENSTNTRGWGQYLQQFFKGVTVNIEFFNLLSCCIEGFNVSFSCSE